MKRKIYTVGGTIGILFLGALIVSIMNWLRPEPKKEDFTPPPTLVFYHSIEKASATLSVKSQGEVRPLTDITLTAQISGKITETGPAFVDGGAFDKGDLLLKIEDADYRAALASAKARLAGAAQNLRLEKAEADLAARDYADLGRNESPSDLVLRLPQLAQAEANYQAAKAEVDTASLNLKRTEIRAPFEGRMRSRSAGLGQFVGAGAQLGQIFSTDVAEIYLSLTDNDLAKLGLPIAYSETDDEPGPAVSLSAVVAGQNQTWQGRVVRTAGAINPSTRQLTVIAVVEDPYGAAAENGAPLAAGLFVDALIEGKPYDEAYILPRSALHGRDIVYAIDRENKLDKRKVFIASSSKDTITVINGLQDGERIVTSPLRGASDGDLVSPVNPVSGEPVLSAADKGAANLKQEVENDPKALKGEDL